MSSKKYSFKDLSSRNDDDWVGLEWDSNDEEESKRKSTRRNVFDIDDGDVETFGLGSGFAPSKSDIKTFMKQSRGIQSLNDYTDDEAVGEPWGGIEYSINQTTTDGSAVESARLRTSSSTSSKSGSFDSVPVERNVKPPRSIPPPNQTVSRPHSSSTSSVTSRQSSSVSSSTSHQFTSSFKSVSSVRAQGTSQEKVSTLQTVASSISDAISSSPQISASEYHRLQTEITKLKKDLQQARRQKKEIPSIQETVRKIMQGEPFILEVYKSYKDKLHLLDYALTMHDGNAIIVIVLFLKRTLRKGLFNTALQTRPKAVNQLCKYMKDHYDFEELAELYRSLGRHEEAAILKLKHAMKSKAPDVRVRQLEKVSRGDFSPYPGMADSTAAVTEYINLLKIQISIDSSDVEAGLKRSNQMLLTHPRKSAIVFYPVITTLYYCTFYHHCESEGIISSPLYINKTFKLTDKQYEWTVLAALGRARKWKLIEEQLTGKGWFGSTKTKSVIGFDKVVEILAKSGAPVDILSKYLRLIDDQHFRVIMATKLKCHDVVIEACVAMKDRTQLQQYRDKMEKFAPQQATITDYLRNSQIKWKN